MNAAEEMVVGAARQAAERGDATVLEASLLIVIDRQEASIRRVRELLDEEQRGYNPPLGLISRIRTALDGER